MRRQRSDQNDTHPYGRTLLRTVGLTKRFGELVAVAGVDFEVPSNSIVSLIGPNGAGKTAFFNLLTGMLKPDAGEVWFNGRRITGCSPDRITTLGVARTFQGIRLFKNMSVLENVMVGQHTRMRNGGLLDVVLRSPEMRREEGNALDRSLRLLDFVGLSSVAHADARNLPYGDQRRLEIARALATMPRLLLLDEPTAGMNPRETASVIDLIDRLRREMGISVLMIEHDMKVVMRISDRVSVLDYGVKIAEGTPEQVRNNARVVEAYLGRSAAAGRELNPLELEPEQARREGMHPIPNPVSGSL